MVLASWCSLKANIFKQKNIFFKQKGLLFEAMFVNLWYKYKTAKIERWQNDRMLNETFLNKWFPFKMKTVSQFRID